MNAIDEAVKAELDQLPLNRLTHFTPARNLPHILRDGELRSVRSLSQDVRACYTITDLRRLDGHPEHICCSFQYPNAFYFNIVRTGAPFANFPDWVCLFLSKDVAARQGTLFCPRNAAALGGSLLAPGAEGLRACYAPTVVGQGNVARTRGPCHDPRSPTDVQSEVLVTAPVPVSDVHAIVVPTEAAAAQEYGRLDRFGLDPDSLTWAVMPRMFDRAAVTAAVQRSQYMEEYGWTASGASRT